LIYQKLIMHARHQHPHNIVALFRLKIIEVAIEKPQEPAEELQHQINTLLQPLTKKDKRLITLQQFLRQLLENNPPPETIEFLQNTLPTIIHSLQEDLTHKRSPRVKAKILKSHGFLKRNTENARNPKKHNQNKNNPQSTISGSK